MVDAALQRIREIRDLSRPINLKPSPYMKTEMVLDSGDKIPLALRDYQKHDVMNLLVASHTCLALDTGLGKTLEVISVCTYIWLKEPEYVPLVIVTKSALFQWKAEIEKFTRDIEAVVVSGGPQDRHRVYEEFFNNYDPKKKRMLLLTYDNVQYDLKESVIREKKTVSAKDKKRLQEIKAKLDDCTEKKQTFIAALKDCGQETGAPYETYAQARIRDHLGKGDGKPLPRPEFWDNNDESTLVKMLAFHDAERHFKTEFDNVQREVNPSVKTSGILALARDMQKRENNKYILIMDEMHKLKNHQSQFHEKTNELALLSDRIIGMTATPVKNRLLEFYSLFRILEPKLFGKLTNFMANFCITKMQRIGGGRQVPVVVGYRNLDTFVEMIEPYYLTRKKHEVAKDLPELLSVEVNCPMFELQDELYELAENGLLNPKDDENRTEEENEAAQMLRALTQCQQAVDSPELIPNEEGVPYVGPSSKVEKLLAIIEENPDDKIIVFSRFETMVTNIGAKLKENKISFVRITGKENQPKVREAAKNKFQDPNSGTNVVLLTNAGAESINLQAASHFVFFDLPYSIGDFLQLIGRMIRIGTIHSVVTAHFLLGVRRSGADTIDHHILKSLKAKKKLADRVAGDNLVSAFKFTDGDMAKEIAQSIVESKKSKTGVQSKKKAS